MQKFDVSLKLTDFFVLTGTLFWIQTISGNGFPATLHRSTSSDPAATSALVRGSRKTGSSSRTFFTSGSLTVTLAWVSA